MVVFSMLFRRIGAVCFAHFFQNYVIRSFFHITYI